MGAKKEDREEKLDKWTTLECWGRGGRLPGCYQGVLRPAGLPQHPPEWDTT